MSNQSRMMYRRVIELKKNEKQMQDTRVTECFDECESYAMVFAVTGALQHSHQNTK